MPLILLTTHIKIFTIKAYNFKIFSFLDHAQFNPIFSTQ